MARGEPLPEGVVAYDHGVLYVPTRPPARRGSGKTQATDERSEEPPGDLAQTAQEEKEEES